MSHDNWYYVVFMLEKKFLRNITLAQAVLERKEKFILVANNVTTFSTTPIFEFLRTSVSTSSENVNANVISHLSNVPKSITTATTVAYQSNREFDFRL